MVDKILREPAACEASGLSRSTLWEQVKAGRFPAPVKLGARAVGWFASEVAQHQEKLKAARDAQKPKVMGDEAMLRAMAAQKS